MKRFVLFLAVLMILFCGVGKTYALTMSFFDDDFIDSEWSSTVMGAGSSIATTEPSGGNPDEYRRVSLTVDPYQYVVNYQLFNLAVFTPATQGAITSVSLSYDIRRVYTSNPGATQIAKGIAVKQDSTIHDYYGGVTSTTTWESFSISNIVPLFPGIDWVNGNQITFGFYDSVGTLTTPFTLDGGYDNFGAEIEYNPIPEPTTIVLMGFGLLGLLGVVIRQRRKDK